MAQENANIAANMHKHAKNMLNIGRNSDTVPLVLLL